MAAKVKVNQDGGLILPPLSLFPHLPRSSVKATKYQRFIAFIYEHDLRIEAFEVITQQLRDRRSGKITKINTQSAFAFMSKQHP